MSSVVSMAEDKKIRQLLKRAEAVGWEVIATKNNHFKVRPTNGGGQFVVGSRSGDPRGIKNAEAMFKRHGLEEVEADQMLRAVEERQQDQMEVEASPTGVNEHEAELPRQRTTSGIDDHTLSIIAFGRQLGEVVDELDDHKARLVSLLRAASNLGLNLDEVAAALEQS